MKLIYKYVSLFLFLSTCFIYGQVNYTAPSNLFGRYTEKTLTKEDYLRKSIRTNPDPESLFELAGICIGKNTISGRAEARQLLTTAIIKAPKKLEYRYLLAEILKKISSRLAYDVYKEIIDIDSASSEALYNLGILEEAEFDDYHNSVFKDGGEPSLSFEKFAADDFIKAEKYLSAAIRHDSLKRDAYMHLSYLYEDNGELEKGEQVLIRLEQLYPGDNEVHLYLGLLYYEAGKIEKSLKEYQQALTAMPDTEKINFTFNSVKELIKPIFGEKFENIPENEVKELIRIFWKITDPLYITDYNERLLEHYSRVAYSNLRFTICENNIAGGKVLTPGWKTDRGEMVLRYGLPVKKVRFRPFINAGGRTVVNMKTDVWYYQYFTLGFTDQYFNNNFVYSELMPGSRYVTQFAGDTRMLVNYLRKAQYQIYTPKFEGPNIEVPYTIAQFRNEKYNYTDVYINYALDAYDSLRINDKYLYNYDWGLFFFDTVYNTVVNEKGSETEISQLRKINLAGNKNMLINSLNMSIYPERGNIAFEIERKTDKGVSSNHFEFNPKKFNTDEPDISDVILAAGMDNKGLHRLPLKRNDISLLPNPFNTFSLSKPVYVYYELYNMGLDKNGSANFDQKLILKRKVKSSGLGNTLNSMLGVIGLGKQKEEVTITTKYQLREKDPQINYQLDMHNYLPGEYTLTLIITDNITGRELNKEITLILY